MQPGSIYSFRVAAGDEEVDEDSTEELPAERENQRR